MTAFALALEYLGGLEHFIVCLPDILRYYIPRRDKDGKWRIEGAQAVTFTPPSADSGADNHRMLRKYGNTLTGAMLVGHTLDEHGRVATRTYRAYVPTRRAQWARDLLAYNGCEVDGLSGETQAARRAHGLPRPWADGGGWAGLRAREAARAKTSKRRPPTGKAAALARIGRWFGD